MNALDQQYVDRNEQRFDAVAHTEPTDIRPEARLPSPPALPQLAAELARRGMSQRHLAELIHVGPKYITRMIAGREPVSNPMRAAIPAALGMDAAELFSSGSPPNPTNIAEMRAVIAKHLEYLDTNAADCTKSAQRGDGSIHMATAADVYEEVAAELRNTLGMDPL
jgi:transcriptional regulator with XRE-family HTH domain